MWSQKKPAVPENSCNKLDFENTVMSMLIATISNKGKITIPKEVRDMLGLHSGDKLEFSCKKGGKLIVRPLKKKVDDLYGKLFKPEREPLSTEAINDAIRSRFSVNTH